MKDRITIITDLEYEFKMSGILIGILRDLRELNIEWSIL